jgi:hypothetical protein
MTKKRCSKCGSTGPFYKRTDRSCGRRHQCIKCDNKYRTLWRKLHPKETSVVRKRQDLKRNFGITLEDWFGLFEKQGRKCAICGDSKLGQGRFCTDHNHKTNKVRGILCTRCNRGIGLLKDSIIVLQAAIKYLRKYN